MLVINAASVVYSDQEKVRTAYCRYGVYGDDPDSVKPDVNPCQKLFSADQSLGTVPHLIGLRTQE